MVKLIDTIPKGGKVIKDIDKATARAIGERVLALVKDTIKAEFGYDVMRTSGSYNSNLYNMKLEVSKPLEAIAKPKEKITVEQLRYSVNIIKKGDFLMDKALCKKIKNASPLIYTEVKIDFDSGNSDSWHKQKKANRNALQACNALAIKTKSIIGRTFGIPVADGKAIYQVIGESKTRFTVLHCVGLGDDWADHHFGYGGSFSKKDVLRYIDWEDGMRKIFGNVPDGR
jgi:hypothetical protein